MTASDGFAEFLSDQLASLGRITLRRMFGKTGVFCDGFMLGMLRDNTLYFRVDDPTCPPLRSRKFADSLVEGERFEPSVPVGGPPFQLDQQIAARKARLQRGSMIAAMTESLIP